jgi:hypothetical protein
VAATIEIVAYPDQHAGITAPRTNHPLTGKNELLDAVEYLFDRAQAEATQRSTSG